MGYCSGKTNLIGVNQSELEWFPCMVSREGSDNTPVIREEKGLLIHHNQFNLREQKCIHGIDTTCLH